MCYYLDYEDHLTEMNKMFPQYCRGDLKQEPSKLLCYSNSKEHYFPSKVEEVSRAPWIMLYHDVLGPLRRQGLIDIAKGKVTYHYYYF